VLSNKGIFKISFSYSSLNVIVTILHCAGNITDAAAECYLIYFATISQQHFLNCVEGRSYFTTDGQSVSQYVLVSNTLVGLATRYYFLSECLSEICGLVSVGRPLS
jgi:hypothetical protein